MTLNVHYSAAYQAVYLLKATTFMVGIPVSSGAAHPLPRYSYCPEDPTTAKVAEGSGDPFRQPFTGAFILLLEIR